LRGTRRKKLKRNLESPAPIILIRKKIKPTNKKTNEYKNILKING
jgi:hypothetical protein